MLKSEDISKKTNVRSFRYSNEVREIIENFEGRSLNDKFDNLVRYCYKEVPRVENRLKDLEAEIDKKRKVFYDLDCQVYRINTFIRDLNEIQKSIETASNRADSIIL